MIVIQRRDWAIDARSLDINGTPGFVIGNRLVPGAIDTQTMQQIVEAERAAAKTRK